MANYLLAKLVASSKPLTKTTRSVSLFQTAAVVGFISSRRCVSTWRETDCEYNYNYNLKIPGRCKSSALDLFNDAFCHRLPATRNLSRLLHLMDREHERAIGFGIEPCGHPRWDVIQDAKALYLLYNMSGIPKMYANNQFVVDHKDFQGSTCDFRHVRVLSNIKRMTSDIIIEEIGPDPKATYKLYSIRLYLRDCIVSDAKVDMESEVLKITIPKKEDKWIHRITVEPQVFSTCKRIHVWIGSFSYYYLFL